MVNREHPNNLNSVNSGAANAGNTSTNQDLIPKPRLTDSKYLGYVNEYIEKYAPKAVEEMNQYGVPASIILAQGIHESGAGESSLAQLAKNHFGVKCTSEWTGPGYYMKDDRPNECFRKYNSAEESFNDHMAFLQRKRYTSLFTLGRGDYRAWAYGLKACGYATNPLYPQILIGIIEKNHLDRFDGNSPADQNSIASNQKLNPFSSMGYIKGRNKEIIVVDTIHQKFIKVDTLYERIYKPKNSSTIDTLVSLTDNSFSATSGYRIKQGDTLYGISRRFNITMDDLRTMNNLPDNSIKIDQVIRVTKP